MARIWDSHLYDTPWIKGKPILYQGPCRICGGEVWNKKDGASLCDNCKDYHTKLSDAKNKFANRRLKNESNT